MHPVKKGQQKKYLATLLFDMDDVLADFGPDWLAIYNKKYNDNLTREDMVDWDTTTFVKEECGSDMYALLRTPGLFRYVKPMPHAVEVINRLIQKGYEIVIVSDSPAGDPHCVYTKDGTKVSNPADDKRAWLKEHFPMIPEKNVVFTGQKYRVRGDVLIDDKPETFETFEELGLNIILMDQPYNRFIQTDKRVKNLLEAEKMIDDMFLKNSLHLA